MVLLFSAIARSLNGEYLKINATRTPNLDLGIAYSLNYHNDIL